MEKGDPFARGTSIAAPRWPFATLAARSTLAIPTCRRGRGGVKGTRVRGSTAALVQVPKAEGLECVGSLIG